MKNLVNQLPDAFIDTKRVTVTYPNNKCSSIDVLEGQLANESKICLKYGRRIGSKDITPRKKRTQRRIDTPEEVHDKQKAHVEAYDKQKAPEEVYGEQEAPVEEYIEQETPEEVRDE